MRAVILTDLSFVTRESLMLHRLEVGLAGEGVMVDLVAPDAAEDVAHDTVYARAHSYPTNRVFKPLPDLRAGRVASLVSQPDERGAEPRPVDVVHVFGEEAWGIAKRLPAPRLLDCALAVEVWRLGIVHRAAQLVSTLDQPERSVLLAPDQAIVEALEKESPPCPVRLAPWGVHAPPSSHAPILKGRDTPVVILASGEDRPACVRCLEGLCGVAASQRIMIVTDDGLATRTDAWSIARRAGALERLTVVPNLEVQRELVTDGGILVLCEPRGEHRSLVLDAMASGMAVLARPDPAVSFLQAGENMRPVSRGTADEWTNSLKVLLSEPQAASALGKAAREFVCGQRRASAYVASVLDAYEQLTSRNPIPIDSIAPC